MKLTALLLLTSLCAFAEYGRVLNGSFVHAPEYISVNGCIVCNPSAAQYAELGWLPVAPVVTNAPSGYRVSVTNYFVDGDAIHAMTATNRIPRRFSVYRVTTELMRLGIWTNAYSYMEYAGLLPLYYTAREFSEDDPNFTRGVRIIREQLNLTDEFIDEVLGKAVVE